MRHFLFEFITGGGMAGQTLPKSLMTEGNMMISALAKDLMRMDTYDIVVCRDYRLSPVCERVAHYMVGNDQPNTIIEQLAPGDKVWLIAPETDGCLVNWVDLIKPLPVHLFTSDVDTVRICSSKYSTYVKLKEHNIPIIATYKNPHMITNSNQHWVIKPDDGAGGNGVHYLADAEQLTTVLNKQFPDMHVVQPYVEGIAMSLSMLCFNGYAGLIGCNRQYIKIVNNNLQLTAIGINECIEQIRELTPLAKAIATAMPGLRGYIGVDLLQTKNNYIVVEINPRLTTSYIGLSRSTGFNIASMIVRTFVDQCPPDLDISCARPVIIPL